MRERETETERRECVRERGYRSGRERGGYRCGKVSERIQVWGERDTHRSERESEDTGVREGETGVRKKKRVRGGREKDRTRDRGGTERERDRKRERAKKMRRETGAGKRKRKREKNRRERENGRQGWERVRRKIERETRLGEK